MKTLSIPFAAWLAAHGDDVVDVLIVGSGYGAAVAAKRFTALGRSVVVLERGSEYLPGDFPNEFGQLPKFQRAEGLDGPIGRATGLFNWRIGSGFASLVANGVGGGSLINAGVAMRPDPEVFSLPQWPAPLRLEFGCASPTGLTKAFETARSELRISTFQHLQNGQPVALPKSAALGRLGDVLKAEKLTASDVRSTGPADVTIDLAKCTRCGDCFTGCNQAGAKLTVRETYLNDAFDAGAVIVSGALVWTLSPLPADMWALRCIETQRSTYRATVQDAVDIDGVNIVARLVVLAAGTFGSTELLQRSKHRSGRRFSLSPALGTRLSGNGDSLSASVDEATEVNALGLGSAPAAGRQPVGPTITSIIDLRNRRNLFERLVIEEGAVPGALADTFQEILATTWTLNQIGERWRTPRANRGSDPLRAARGLASHTQLLLTMGHDTASGRIVYLPEMGASVPYWVRPEDEATYKRQEFVLAFADRLGGKHLLSPLWRSLPKRASDALGQALLPATTLTVHPLGGCPMGDDFSSGVVDHRGRVFRRGGSVYPTLLVLDASIIPTSLGCNPLLTITALAERAMALAAIDPLISKNASAPSARKVTPTPRSARALERPVPLVFDITLKEHLRTQAFDVTGALGDAMGTEQLTAGLSVRMSSTDWSTVWQSKQHELTDVAGRLTLRDTASDKRVDYRIVGGSITLVEPVAAGWLAPLRTLQACATWWLMRGLRDAAHKRADGQLHVWDTLRNLPTLWNMLTQAGADRRSVRYQLRLRRSFTSQTVKEAPTELVLHAIKSINFAANWSTLLNHAYQRWVVRDPLWPGDLKPTYFEQLTEPHVVLHHPSTFPALTRALFEPIGSGKFKLDLRSALSMSPVSLNGGGDSTAAALAIAAYPALIARHALRSRIFDFRLPDYSSAPVEDSTDPESLFLRAEKVARRAPVLPTPYSVRVRRGSSSADDGSEARDNLELPLWRYGERLPNDQPAPPQFAPGRWNGIRVQRAKSVLLMHAFGMSGSTYTSHGPDTNLAEFLFRKGYEVWVFDTRMSPRVGGSSLQGTLDQVGLIDAPAVVDRILEILRPQSPLSPALPLQISCFAHCLGSGAMLVGLLGGRLSYPVHAFGPSGPLLPKISALVCSQVHPLMVGSESSLSKTWVAPLARDVLRRVHIPLAIRGPVTSVVDQLIDRWFASLPVPDGERCPDEGSNTRKFDDDCATCRRIRFLDAELFKHRNISPKTHRLLPALFGPANIRTFAHASKFVDYERLVTEDGLNAYATDEAIARYLALPVRFVHGELNELFNVAGAVRSSQQYERIHPGLAATFASSRTGHPHHVVTGYGHLDLLIGENLDQRHDGEPSVFEQLVDLLEQAWVNVDQRSAQRAAQSAVCDARFPGLGPWVSPAIRDSKGRRSVGLSFVVDDLTDSSAPAGATLSASAIVHRGSSRSVIPLRVSGFAAPIVARDGFLLPTRRKPIVTTEFPTTVRIAHGRIPVRGNERGLRIELISHFDPQRLGTRAYDRSHHDARVHASKTAGLMPPSGPHSRAARSVDPAELRTAIVAAREHQAIAIAHNSGPFPLSLSKRELSPVQAATRWINIRTGILQSKGLFDEIRIAAGCCRYPGFPYDTERSDQTFGRLMKRVRGRPEQRPHVGLMLGDQIYADASAHVADPLSAVERFHRRHFTAFSTRNIQRLFASLPIVMSADDHEYTDDYPIAGPLFAGQARRRRYAALREAALRRAALDATKALQYSTYDRKDRDYGCCTFELGEVRVLVLDTRAGRRRHGKSQVRLLTTLQRTFVRDWLAGASARSLQIVCTGSVVFPSIARGADPANPGLSDSWNSSPRERAWLLAVLSRFVPRRFVLLSGDYHLSGGARITENGQDVGLALVAPPFYAPLPYANANPEDLDLDEQLTGGGKVFALSEASTPQRGSGYATIRVQRLAPLDEEPTWDVRLDVDVDDPLSGQWTGLKPLGHWTL